jgi:hypothetical protein
LRVINGSLLVISPSHIEIWSLGQGRVRLRNVFEIFKINIEGAKYVGHMDLGYQDHRIHYLVYFFHIYKDCLQKRSYANQINIGLKDHKESFTIERNIYDECVQLGILVFQP